jgi:hypothetical protein
MAVRIVGVIEAEPPTIRRDERMPLGVHWFEPATVAPLYLMISGSDGGYVEMNWHPIDGRLTAYVVIDRPPAEGGAPSLPSLGSASEERAVVPVIDRSPWKPNPDLVPTIEIVDHEARMRFNENEQGSC